MNKLIELFKLCVDCKIQFTYSYSSSEHGIKIEKSFFEWDEDLNLLFVFSENKKIEIHVDEVCEFI